MEVTSRPQSSGSEEESFVILGSSPSNLYSHVNIERGKEESDVESLLISKMSFTSNPAEEGTSTSIIKPTCSETTTDSPFKANFQLSNMASSASMLLANSHNIEEISMDDLKQMVSDLRKDNSTLKETLKVATNTKRKEFENFASWQEDMMKTHNLHKAKFEETKLVISKLRSENSLMHRQLESLKFFHQNTIQTQPIDQQLGDTTMLQSMDVLKCSNISDFVLPTDDDTIDKLSDQLALVEKQRRLVISEKQNLQWQIESMEAATQQITKENEELKNEVLMLKEKLKEAENTSADETALRCLEEKNSFLHVELKAAQVKILEMENNKLSHSMQKSDLNEQIKVLNARILEQQSKLRDFLKVMFQPVPLSLTANEDCEKSEFSDFETNVHLYERTLKHLADFLNQNSMSVCHVSETLNDCLSVVEEKSGCLDGIRDSLAKLKLIAQQQQMQTAEKINQIKATMTIFETIFDKYKEMLKLLKQEREEKERLFVSECSKNEMLGAAESELTLMRGTLANLRDKTVEREVLEAQLDIYRSDFEAERSARLNSDGEINKIREDMRLLHRRLQNAQNQIDTFKRQYPHLMPGSMGVGGVSTVPHSRYSVSPPSHGFTSPSGSPPPLCLECPICNKGFKSFKLLEEHVDMCSSD